MRPTIDLRIMALLLLLTVWSGRHLCAQSVSQEQRTDMSSVSPKHEVRAVWLTTIKNLDWPHTYAKSQQTIAKQQEELRAILDSLKRANVNTILFQTRIRGTVVYPSAYEPWDACLTGTQGRTPNYDVLQFAIEECHKRGMEIHAWLVSIPVGKWNSAGCKKLRAKYPKAIKNIKGEGYMNPERPETADHIAKICAEITENYDIDGIHLDYIRYPETWKVNISKNKARAHITEIVRKASNNVKALKPWVKMSCAPIGKYSDLDRYKSYGWNAYNKGCQDAQLWLKEGYMDMLFPMIYFDGRHYYPFIMDWKENDHGRIVAAGLGTYMLSPEERDWNLTAVERQINVARTIGLGYAHFRSRFFTDNTKGIYEHTINDLNRYPALVPAMTWEKSTRPETPRSLVVRRLKGGDELTWNEAGEINKPDTSNGLYRNNTFEKHNGDYLTYNVYASESYPIDINDPRLLIATRLMKPMLSIPGVKNTNMYYAITATDRYGNESMPITTEPAPLTSTAKSTLPNDGKTLHVSAKDETRTPFINTTYSTFDASYAIIETLQGVIIATKTYNGTSIDISDIADGVYVVKSLGRKGIVHRLGHFIIKRETE